MILGCEGLADYHCGLHSLDVPVSSGTQQRSTTTYTITKHFDSELEESFGSTNWGTVQSSCPREDRSWAGNLRADNLSSTKSAEDSRDVRHHRLDTEGIALYIDLVCSPVKSLPDLRSEKSRAKSSILRQELDLSQELGSLFLSGSLEREKLRMTNPEEVTQGSDSKFSVSIGDQLPVTLCEADNVQRLKRSRQITSIEQSQGSPSHAEETFQAQAHSNAVSEIPQEQDDLLQNPYNDMELSLRKSGSEAHAIAPMPGEDKIQIFKRRRVDTASVNTEERDLTGDEDDQSATRPHNGKSALPEAECKPKINGLASPNVFREHLEGLCADGYDEAHNVDPLDVEIETNGDLEEIRTARNPPRPSEGDSVTQMSCTPPRYIGSPAQGHVPKKKEWLGHHGTKVGMRQGRIGIPSDAGFAGSIGDFYKEAIDGRPVAEFPGVVGDGATAAQLCNICGQIEDNTGSLICDGCEKVFHMTCINSRMKIIPQADDWYCRQCKKLRKEREVELMTTGGTKGTKDFSPQAWWREDSVVGRVERELMRMSNGQRMKVRVGPDFQADVPDFTDGVDTQDALAESCDQFGQEIALTDEEKQWEQELSEYNVKNDIWPKGWVPAASLPPGTKENWIQCTLALYEIGDTCPDGRRAETNVVCGKWRRAPEGVIPDETWECSCVVTWDPRHADCAVPQELPTTEIFRRMKVGMVPNYEEESSHGLIQDHDQIRQKVVEAMMDEAKGQGAVQQGIGRTEAPTESGPGIESGAAVIDSTQEGMVIQAIALGQDAVKQQDSKPERKNQRTLKKDARRQGANSNSKDSPL